MLFNLFIWRAENPAMADKSAPTDGQTILSKVIIGFLRVSPGRDADEILVIPS